MWIIFSNNEVLDYELYSFLQSKDIKKKGKFNKFQQGLSTIEYEVCIERY